jgi:hypothetical protein
VEAWDDTRQSRLVKNEEAARAYNSRRAAIEEAAGAEDEEPLPFLCECGDRDCVATVVLSLDEFVDAHRPSNQFVVRPGHVYPEVERVVADRDDYWLVQKDPELMPG